MRKRLVDIHGYKTVLSVQRILNSDISNKTERVAELLDVSISQANRYIMRNFSRVWLLRDRVGQDLERDIHFLTEFNELLNREENNWKVAKELGIPIADVKRLRLRVGENLRV
jgi:hypothetical protein